MSKKNKNTSPFVYSTNPSFVDSLQEDEEIITLKPEEQILRIFLEKKHRGGKMVTLITGFVGENEDLKSLGKSLQTLCGSGGSAKNNEILIQGDHKQKIFSYLIGKGYKKTKMV